MSQVVGIGVFLHELAFAFGIVGGILRTAGFVIIISTARVERQFICGIEHETLVYGVGVETYGSRTSGFVAVLVDVVVLPASCLTALVGSVRGELARIDIGIDAFRQASFAGVVGVAGYVYGVPGIVRDDVDNAAYGIASVQGGCCAVQYLDALDVGHVDARVAVFACQTLAVFQYQYVVHIDGVIGETKDFSLLIEQAKHCAPPTELEQGTIVGGFAHAQVLALADQIVDAVKSGAIKKFVVMAGCDGRAKSRSYYSDFAQALPKDTVILTAGCAKYKYNKLNLGDINGIPRVLDAGQCNDSYSLAVIALKLKEVFGLDDINDLPIIYNISWYEQKAVIVLLALLSLGVKNIHLGPTLPAFLSPNVAALLVENFGIAGIDTVENDMELFFGK